MKKKQLYKNNYIYLTEHLGEDCTESRYVRLIADDGMAITNGETVTVCVDVLAEDAQNWRDCEMPEAEDPEEATESDYQSALRDMGVEV
ncbi:MAG: hypothetical protein J6V25_04130 [Oscillospiraceae bacterium]|nr:hypothetical protein [Oscillospiraceae bacterium]